MRKLVQDQRLPPNSAAELGTAGLVPWPRTIPDQLATSDQNDMMRQVQKILVAGASIAGPALAYWLSHYGFEVVVIERAPELRLDGQNIDVNGVGQQVARLMGLEDAIRAASTGEVGTQFVNQHNQVQAALASNGPNGLTQELEILRGDLVRILYERTRQQASYRFDESIVSLEQSSTGVTVTFTSGPTESFDLVIAADGIRSKTRQLMFGQEPVFNYLGLCSAYLTIPKQRTDTDWARWYTATGGRVILLRPDNQGTTRAGFLFRLPEAAYSRLASADYTALTRQKLAGMGWESARLMAAIEAGQPMYFDGLGQIKAPRWSNGRLAMLGDAAYCASPLSGSGTTLALVGAYLLAGELATHERYRDGLVRYEQQMRPFVDSVQAIPPGLPQLLCPQSRVGVWLLNQVVGLAASRSGQAIADYLRQKQASKVRHHIGFVLPTYT